MSDDFQTYTLEEAAAYCKEAPASLDRKANAHHVAYCKSGRHKVFFRKDLIAYLESGRVKSNAELEAEATKRMLKRGA